MAIIKYRGRYKIKTHIKGLDDILHGGIVFNGLDIGKTEDADDGVLLSINGERGVNKTAFAIHMCHGITRSLYRIKGIEAEKNYRSILFSVNKTKKLLQQTHENAAISRLLRRGIQDFVINRHKGHITSSLLYQVVSAFFSDLATINDIAEGNHLTDFANRYKENDIEICKLLAQGTVSFNVHSRTLNFKHLKSNTGLNRIRKFVGFEHVKFSEGLINEYLQAIEFNGIEEITPKFISRFEQILDKISDLFEKCEDGKKKLPCLVIDGLSQLSDDELKTIPIDYLQRILRKIAFISILVFDERGKNVCRNSDVVIELNRNTDKEICSLSYYTLEIKKCMIQKFSFGKHLYKLTDTGISVFPSLEHILNNSALKSDIYSDLNRGMFNTSYGSYLKGFHRHLFNNALVNTDSNEYDVLHNTIESNLLTYDNYIDKNASFRDAYIENIYQKYAFELGDRQCEKLLNNILFQAKITSYNKSDIANSGNLVTSLVSCKNSYKRTLSNAVIFNSLQRRIFNEKGERVTKDVLFISFGNNRQQLLRTVACPCLKESHYGKQCLDCYDRIHLYSVPFGDISASEMIYMIDDIIDTYNKVGSQHLIGQIIIDDLNGDVVRNAHPFIYSDKLLVPALFKLLREKQIPVTILSDISEQGYKEICVFADNVIFTKRRQISKEPGKELLDVYVAKDYRLCNPRRLYGCSLKISDYSNLIKHDGDTFTLRSEAVINDREVSPLEIDLFNYNND